MGRVLVTGGAGYIGSHVMVVLGRKGYRCVCLDNFSNSSPRAVERAQVLAPGAIEAVEADIRDTEALRRVLAGADISSVIHLAGLKAVGESVEKPALYRDNNVRGTQCLLEALAGSGVRTFVFSSSATVYGNATAMPIGEDAPTAPASPYGENKLEIERMLAKLAGEDPSWRVASLRYFNPVGAHESGTIGEHPSGTPNNLMPYVCQAAAGLRGPLRVFGTDYPTPDGTGIRDYIHVMDLAEGHMAALTALPLTPPGTVMTVNLGTGMGHSVLEVVDTFERVNGVKVPRELAGRRPGDVPICYADCSRARQLLRWSSRRTLEDMCRDAWRWQVLNPAGY
ncbi:MAG: UDP-glucose 4-epimerase GalE [Lysobacter sp.]|nr:UDP-glucose 4-epimerase GalE [Lysobacter sp.]